MSIASTPNPPTFRGYPTDLLLSLKAHGRALVGDDDLYEAAQAYTDPASGGGHFGRALLDILPQAERRRLVEPTVAIDEPADEGDEEADPWAGVSLLQMRNLLLAHQIEVPRTMTRGGAIKRLDAAHIPPPG